MARDVVEPLREQLGGSQTVGAILTHAEGLALLEAWDARSAVVEAAKEAVLLEHDPARNAAENALMYRRAEALRDALARLYAGSSGES